MLLLIIADEEIVEATHGLFLTMLCSSVNDFPFRQLFCIQHFAFNDDGGDGDVLFQCALRGTPFHGSAHFHLQAQLLRDLFRVH